MTDTREHGVGTLWLVPGHLGHHRDVSFRAIDLLGSAGAWVVEEGSSKAIQRILREQQIDAAPIIHLPDLQPGEPTIDRACADQVLAVLRRGEDVVFFGVEEGIVGWGDPGSELIQAVEEAMPEAPIRTVGGASVVGCALMRVPVPLRQVVVTWPIDRVDDRIRKRIHDFLWFGADGQLATLWLVRGVTAKEIGAYLASFDPVLQIDAWLMVRMTKPDEAFIAARFGDGPTPKFAEGVEDRAPCVLVLRPRWNLAVRRSRWSRVRHWLWRASALGPQSFDV